jgi:hypothetical protein
MEPPKGHVGVKAHYTRPKIGNSKSILKFKSNDLRKTFKWC